MTADAIWWVFAEVEALDTEHGMAPGKKAFTNVFVPAGSKDECLRHLTETLSGMGFHLVMAEECELWSQRCDRMSVSKRHSRLAKTSEREGKIVFDGFHTWNNQG